VQQTKTFKSQRDGGKIGQRNHLKSSFKPLSS
jgi:hypothetical protein